MMSMKKQLYMHKQKLWFANYIQLVGKVSATYHYSLLELGVTGLIQARCLE